MMAQYLLLEVDKKGSARRTREAEAVKVKLAANSTAMDNHVLAFWYWPKL